MKTLKTLSVLFIVLLFNYNLYAVETDINFHNTENTVKLQTKQNTHKHLFRKFHLKRNLTPPKDGKPKIERYALRSFIIAASGIVLSAGVVLPLAFAYDFFLLSFLIMGILMFITGFIAIKQSLISFRNFKAAGDKHRGKGFAITALVLSIIELLSPLAAVAVTIWAISQITIPINI